MIGIRQLASCSVTLVAKKHISPKTINDLASSFTRTCCVTNVRMSTASSALGLSRAKISKERLENDRRMCWKQHRTYATMKGISKRKPPMKVVDEGFQDVEVDPSMYKLGFEDVEELQDADEIVKKLFTLEYASNFEIQRLKGDILKKRVRESEDGPSHEVNIAILTLQIRNLAEHMKHNRKDMLNKRRLLMAIDRRNKLLGYLRRNNYDRFQWLLKELGIQYSVPPSKIIKLSKKQREERAVKKKAYYDRQKALYEYFKQKIEDADAEELEKTD
ncbi:small ribosomal subunit protein uS15m-like isoform X2 [Ptychodera flava]|uniref:small ribosomal subunit protein uS15m-like isoform X2 n=1 Tax=Ptychodera flava TaxID=63121 RepID=UPI00396A5F0A